MKALKEYLLDKYLTWKTGKTKEEREWISWYDSNVVYRARTIPNMFMHFKHVIEVDTQKFMNLNEPFAWVPCEDAKQYFWPQRPVTDTCVWRFERVIWDQWDKCWHINTLGDEDKVFVATNNERDAIMIALKYMG